MLVLSRKESQRIKLGDSIVVTVIRVTGDKVRLGIEAPSDVLVLRGELDSHETASPSVGVGLDDGTRDPEKLPTDTLAFDSAELESSSA